MKETDAIFTELRRQHDEAENCSDTVRVSIDTKATVKVGPFSRGGYNRTGTQGTDHDFQGRKLTPSGSSSRERTGWTCPSRRRR